MTFFAFFQNRFMVPICVFLDAKWHLVISLHFKECEFTIFQTKKKIVKIRGGVKVGRRVVPTCWSHSAITFFDPPRKWEGGQIFLFILLDFNIL